MSSPSSHRPRRRRKGDDTGSASSVEVDAVTGVSKPAFPLAAFLWPAKGSISQWAVLPLILMAVGLFRWATGFWGYSGLGKPPMHGDFEAQRHWMEITAHLPVSQCWVLAKIGSFVNPLWFALHTSRGLDDPSLKVYMRATVFCSEYFVYVPAVIVFLRHYSRLQGIGAWDYSVALTAILMQPATMLIDHGHFQYNTVMLGFVLASMSSMLAGRYLWGCVFFVAALGFKQMALFYAPAVFAYLLGTCISPRLDIPRLFKIALVTVLAFVLLFSPLLLGSLYDSYRNVPPDPSGVVQSPPLLTSIRERVTLSEKSWYFPPILQLTQSIHRILPFSRGLFEDKVPNLWCALHASGVHKLHQYAPATVQRAALAATSLSIMPPCLVILARPRRELLPWALATCAWAFFLCSYQVHEKSSLLPLLPMTVLLGGQRGLTSSTRAWIGFANVLSTWTLFPLLKKDELRVPYFVLTLLWAWLMGLPPTSLALYRGSSIANGGLRVGTRILHLSFYAAMVVWHGVEAFVPTPKGKPDLWVVLNVLVGAAGFGICYLWCLWGLVAKSEIVGIGLSRKKAKGS
ncbi:hypothetical protein B0A49_04506 [Cryomyces minteri]|uniref:Alpha-1,3-glucosyltransferase n=1 Tax=Cryomyces minteri TaxID=331657 RepID=A0A4U0XNR7_9PEZI|nr:hypothetical protein B0A49_04506 [Cryomyces minteri]